MWKAVVLDDVLLKHAYDKCQGSLMSRFRQFSAEQSFRSSFTLGSHYIYGVKYKLWTGVIACMYTALSLMWSRNPGLLSDVLCYRDISTLCSF